LKLIIIVYSSTEPEGKESWLEKSRSKLNENEEEVEDKKEVKNNRESKRKAEKEATKKAQKEATDARLKKEKKENQE
jgi:hypothetical protein